MNRAKGLVLEAKSMKEQSPRQAGLTLEDMIRRSDSAMGYQGVEVKVNGVPYLYWFSGRFAQDEIMRLYGRYRKKKYTAARLLQELERHAGDNYECLDPTIKRKEFVQSKKKEKKTRPRRAEKQLDLFKKRGENE